MTPRDFLSDESEPISEPTNEKLEPRDFLAESPKENIGYSIAAAIPRVGEDVIKGGYQALQKIPEYYQAAKKEVPGAINSLIGDPKHALGQGIAGLAEAGQNIFNMPHDIANYATNRLNLIPEDINNKIQMARMPDSENEINATFGEPLHVGEKLIRGIGRNAVGALGDVFGAKTLNPLQLTNAGTAKKVVNELNRQVENHTNMYNGLWKKAEKQGFNEVPYDKNALHLAPEILEKFYPEKSVLGLKDFMENPTLEKAQKAQSDLGILRRAIEEKAKTSPLLETEKGLHQHLYDTEKHIESSMFRDKSGNLNQKLADKYKKITNSYRENVVPYKYNSDIQDYLSKDITAKQLVQRLNQGPFAAKKGNFLTHPQFAIRNALLPIAGGIGTIGGAKYLYDQALGNGQPRQ